MRPATTAAAASSSLTSSRRSPPPHPRSPVFTPIMENEKEGEGDEEAEPKEATTAATAYKHQPTPLHPSTNNTPNTATAKKPARSIAGGGKVEELSVSFNKCRPSARDKTSTSVVPLDSNGLVSPGPNGMLRSLFFSLTHRSPRSSASSSSSSAAAVPSTREEEWKLAAAELSRKLIHATRKRDEAVNESARLKHSLAELEKKLDRLESYCHDLKSALDSCGGVVHPQPKLSVTAAGFHVGSLPVDPFLRAISEARSGVRHLSRALSTLMRHAGPKSMDRLATLLHPYEVPAVTCRNPRSLLFYLEALLNQVFYANFESGLGFAGGPILDPATQCEANRKAYESVRGVSWDDVLSHGTRYYSEGLSRFCDRRMGEVVTMLAWAKAWPEALLQAFFGAAKGVWLVYLLARCVHPAVPLLRVEPGNQFDPGYMEDVAAERVRRLSPTSIKKMVAPGFFVYAASSGVIKCKVLCMYNNSIISSSNTNSDSGDGVVV